MKGYMGRILRVDLGKGSVLFEQLNAQWAKDFIGGRGALAFAICLKRWTRCAIPWDRRTN